MITDFQQKLREKRDQKFKDELEHIRATEAGELKEKLANFENIANKQLSFLQNYRAVLKTTKLFLFDT